MLIPVNNPNFPIQIRQYGSRFRCLLGIAEFHLDKELSIEKIAKIYDIARNMPEVMDESCFCTQEDHRLTKMAFLALKNNHLFVRQVGYCARQDGEEIACLPLRGRQDWFDYSIREWKTEEEKHYATLHHKTGTMLSDFWDTIWVDRPVVQTCQTQTYYKVFDIHGQF